MNNISTSGNPKNCQRLGNVEVSHLVISFSNFVHSVLAYDIANDPSLLFFAFEFRILPYLSALYSLTVLFYLIHIYLKLTVA